MDPLSVTLAVALLFAVFAFGVLVGSLVSSSRQRKKAAVASIQTAMHAPSTPVTKQPSMSPEGAKAESAPAATSALETLPAPVASTAVIGGQAPAFPLPTVDADQTVLSAEPLTGVDSLLASADVSSGGDAPVELLPPITVPLVVEEHPEPALEPEPGLRPQPEIAPEPALSELPQPEVVWDIGPEPDVEPEFELEAEVASALEPPAESSIIPAVESPEPPAPEVVWEIGPEPEPVFESASEEPVAGSEFAWELPVESPHTAEPDGTPSTPESELTWVMEPESTLPPVFESPEPVSTAVPELEPAWLLDPETIVEPETGIEWPPAAEPTPVAEQESAIEWPPVAEAAATAAPEPAIEWPSMTEPASLAEPAPAPVDEPEPAIEWPPVAEAAATAAPAPAPVDEPEPAIEWPPVAEPAPEWPIVTEPASVQGAVPDEGFAWAPGIEEALAPEPVPEASTPAEEIVTPSAAPHRPRAHVRAIPEDASPPSTPGIVTVPRESAPSPHVRTESIDMVAPVQMWFGDYAVAVKAGSKTHTQFRKYADVLLGELKDAGERSR